MVEASTLTNKKIAPLLKRFINVRVMQKQNPELYQQVPVPRGTSTLPVISVTDYKKNNYGTASAKITPEMLEPLLKNALKKMGRPISAKLARQMSQNYAAAVKAIEAERYTQALRLLRKIKRVGGKSGPAARAEEKVREILAVARKRLDAAQAKADANEHAEAAKLFNGIVSDFPGTDTAKEAETAMQKLKANPAAAAAIEKMISEQKAEKAFRKAQEYEDDKKIQSALRAYRKVIKDFPQSEFASKAKERIAELEKTVASRDTARAGRKLKSLMNMARNFAANDKTKMAVQYYKKVIELAPDSPEAVKAKAEIAKLRSK